MSGVISRLTAAACCVATLLLAGCEHKELCYDHGHSVEVEVRFRWDAAPDADPHTMVVNFFSPDGTYVTCREFSSRDGGKIKIDAGAYKILFHNGEMESVHEVVDDYDRYCLTTVGEMLLAPLSRDMGTPPRPSGAADEPVRSPAESVWAGRHESVLIEPDREGQLVELYPEQATARYTVEVVNVENLRDNLGISAALTGLSERLNIGSGSAAGQPVTVPFSVGRKDGTTLEAKFLTFGHCPEDKAVSHIVSIYTSSKVYYNFDVTDQVHSAPDDRNIYIRIDGLRLPPEGEDVSPSVDSWSDEEDVEIKMQ